MYGPQTYLLQPHLQYSTVEEA